MGEVRNGVTVANSQVDLLFEAAFLNARMRAKMNSACYAVEERSSG